MTDETIPRDIDWYAAAIDRAGRAESVYSMAHAVHDEVGIPPFHDLPDAAEAELKAVCWVFDYAIEFDGNNKARLVPRHQYADHFAPPAINEVGDDIRQAWSMLLDRVESPAGRARLAHALFQCGGTKGLEHAKVAAENYLLAADHWQRLWDADEDLRAAARLARIIDESELTQQALEKLLDAAETGLAGENIDAPGPILRPLEYVVGEPDCPARVDTLLSRAAVKLPEPDDRDRALKLIFGRCRDDESRNLVWHRRVDNFLTAADATSGIMQMIRRRNALEIAEASAMNELKERAAAALQSTRKGDLELVSVQSSSIMYQEVSEQLRDAMSAGATWQEALISFATYGPLSGDHEQNCAHVQNMRNLAPIMALLPDCLIGPDGLPIYEATSPEDRFDGDLTKWETHIISNNLLPLTTALHSIPERFGLPETAELAAFLSSWPSMNRDLLPIATSALQRFWCGDFEGATYIATPWIEAAIRQLIIDAEHGMYRLQSIHRPGQYPGLGAMLDLLPGLFTLSTSAHRFLKAMLVHSRGLNLRNHLSHGMIHYNTSTASSLVIHTLLMITLMTPSESRRRSEAQRENSVE